MLKHFTADFKSIKLGHAETSRAIVKMSGKPGHWDGVDIMFNV
jgi:hypothetical protein